MARRAHRIHQQQINLGWGNIGEPFQLEKQLTQFAKQQLLPKMESVFDEVTRDGRVMQLDKVVIDIGDICSSRSSSWQQVFCERFVARLQELLLQQKTDTQVPDTYTEDDEQSVEILFKQFLFFLNNGRLPWWASTREAATLRKAVGLFTPEQVKDLSEVLNKNDLARHRLIAFCTDEQLEQCFSLLYALDHVARIVTFFVPIPSDDVLYKSWRHYCWSRLFQAAAAKQQVKAVRKHLHQLFVLQVAITTLKKGGRQGLKTLEPGDQPRQGIAALPEPWRTWIGPSLIIDHHWQAAEQNAEGLLRRLVAGECFDKLIRTTPLTRHGYLQPDELAPPTEDGLLSETEVTAVPESIKKKDKAVEGSIWVAAAGALIVHPFLEELFSEQSLLKDNDFRSKECRHSAVHMLTYLAFGDLDIEEYDLLLPKLLCAMPWEQPLLPWRLTEEQRKNCDALLIAILHHWSALKSQSVQFLRQQFFWRNGKLKSVDGGWQLTIEKRAQDILLDKLPWGVGVINLPWMNEMLHVTWET